MSDPHKPKNPQGGGEARGKGASREGAGPSMGGGGAGGSKRKNRKNKGGSSPRQADGTPSQDNVKTSDSQPLNDSFLDTKEKRDGQKRDHQPSQGSPATGTQGKERHSSSASDSLNDKKTQAGQKGPKGPKMQDGQEQKGQKGQEEIIGDGEVKTKAQLRAERRAKQEAQRAAKAAAQGGGNKKDMAGGTKETPRVPDTMRADDERTRRRFEKRLERQQVPSRVPAQRKVGLFNHLHQYEREKSLTTGVQFSSTGIHPAILQLGLQYAEGLICGSNARCIALLAALKRVISDYSTPPDKDLARDLDARIKPYITFLNQCRPKSVSMGNAIKYIKWHINSIPEDMPDVEAKEKLNEAINVYLHEKILLAGEAISKTYASSKIRNGDVIMVYACSSLIQKVLQDAYDMGRKFRVVVVDGRPKLEGREMLRRLVKHGIQCTYVLINAASHVFPEVTKVMLGAHALLANGYVMSRVGSSQIALLAKAYNVPVLVCCETYKFCERVQTDSFVFNELGDPDDVARVEKQESSLHDWKEQSCLSVLNLVYDVTPPELVTMVITEVGMVPCTSVPVVLRVKHVEGDSYRD